MPTTSARRGPGPKPAPKPRRPRRPNPSCPTNPTPSPLPRTMRPRRRLRAKRNEQHPDDRPQGAEGLLRLAAVLRRHRAVRAGVRVLFRDQHHQQPAGQPQHHLQHRRLRDGAAGAAAYDAAHLPGETAGDDRAAADQPGARHRAGAGQIPRLPGDAADAAGNHPDLTADPAADSRRQAVVPVPEDRSARLGADRHRLSRKRSCPRRLHGGRPVCLDADAEPDHRRGRQHRLPAPAADHSQRLVAVPAAGERLPQLPQSPRPHRRLWQRHAGCSRPALRADHGRGAAVPVGRGAGRAQVALSDPRPGGSAAARWAARVILAVAGIVLAIGIGLIILFGFTGAGPGFVVLGLILLVIFGFLEPESLRAFLGQGELQAGTRAIAQAVLVVAAVVLLNMVVRDRLSDAKLDVTKGKVNTLAPQTISVLKSLDSQVQVTVWYGQQASEMDTAYNLLTQYHNINSFLVVQRYSVLDRPQLAQQQKVTSADSVVFTYKTRAPQVTAGTTEHDFTTALLSRR